MNRTRLAALALLLVLSAGGVAAQPPGEAYSSPEGKFAAKFPGKPKVAAQTTKSAIGDLKVTVATFAAADANVYMVGYTDFPVAATAADNRKTLFDGVRDAVRGKGEVTSEKEIEFGPDKLPGRELVVEKDKGKVRTKYRMVLRDNRLYQQAVIGTAEFVSGKDAVAFLDSLSLTK